jgi:nucleotide-binding universal stress UspA family protein
MDSTSAPAQPLKTLLAATDLSAHADWALERAVHLAGAHGARLVVLHVYDENLPSSVQDQVASSARQEIETFLGKIGVPDDLDLTVEVKAGRDHRDILEVAEAIDADLIVMGTHRKEGGLKAFRSTTMERVIRTGTRPVLVVVNRVAGPYAKALVGVDFSVFSRFAIRGGLMLAPSAEFHLVHAFQVPFEGLQPGLDTRRDYRVEHERKLSAVIESELLALMESSGNRAATDKVFRPHVSHGETQGVLRTEVARLAPDLLVLGTHGRVGIAHALLGSVAESFLNNPPCDVLLVKAW